jgi:hypothetical protein
MKISVRSLSDPSTETASLPSGNTPILNQFVQCTSGAWEACPNVTNSSKFLFLFSAAIPTIQSAQQQGTQVQLTLSSQFTGVSDPTKCSYVGALVSTL